MRARFPLLLVLASTPAFAQQANVDLSSAAGTPQAGYAGVVPFAGAWNSVPTNAVAFPLVGPDGTPSGLTLTVSGASEVVFDHPATSGDAAALMEDGARSTGTITLTLTGFVPVSGWDLYLYGWAPDAESQRSRVSYSSSFQEDVGGSWGDVGQAYGRTWTLLRGLGYTDPEVIEIAPAPGSSLATVNGFQIVFGCEHCGEFCNDRDRALGSCPCGNPGAPDRGCDDAQGTGGVRLTVGARTTSRATLIGTGFPPAARPTALLVRAEALRPTPFPFGDGLLCLGLQGYTRLAATSAVEGTSTHAFGHGAGSGEFYYQIWYRNLPVGFCVTSGHHGGAFNLSNGRALVW
jgi:hypothetical protein